MENRASLMAIPLFISFLITSIFSSSSAVSMSKASFKDNFDIMFSESNFKTSKDGQIWYLSLDKTSGVVTAYYVQIRSILSQMCTEDGAGPTRDEVDFEFLGNRTGEPYLIQTNVYKNGTGGREMRHVLWFDPTEDFHTYSVLWNTHQLVFFVDRVPVRVYKNNGKPNNFFPDSKPMYLFSSIWNADDWATRGGLEKTDWKKAPFVSTYKDFSVDGCQWEDPYPSCVSTTTENWWDQYSSWHLSDSQKKDYAWVKKNLVIYDYCEDKERYPTPMEECSLSPWD